MIMLIIKEDALQNIHFNLERAKIIGKMTNFPISNIFILYFYKTAVHPAGHLASALAGHLVGALAIHLTSALARHLASDLARHLASALARHLASHVIIFWLYKVTLSVQT